LRGVVPGGHALRATYVTELSDLSPVERAKRYRALEAEVGSMAGRAEGDIRAGFLNIARSWGQLATELEATLTVQAAEVVDNAPEHKEAAFRPPDSEPKEHPR